MSEYKGSRGIAKFFYLNKVFLHKIYLCILTIIFPISFMCSFPVRCWSNKTPRSLTDFSLCISKLFIISSVGEEKYRLSYLAYWAMSILFFPYLKIASLFAVNQSLMFTSLLYTKRCLMSIKDFLMGAIFGGDFSGPHFSR